MEKSEKESEELKKQTDSVRELSEEELEKAAGGAGMDPREEAAGRFQLDDTEDGFDPDPYEPTDGLPDGPTAWTLPEPWNRDAEGGRV